LAVFRAAAARAKIEEVFAGLVDLADCGEAFHNAA